MGSGEKQQDQGESSSENIIAAASSISSMAEDLQRTVVQSKDSALRSARSLQHFSSSHFRSFQDFVPHAVSQLKTYEDVFFTKVKDELKSARDHPAATVGVAVSAGLLLMRGPRRFLFRHTFGRFQTEEANFVKAEKHVKELNLSVDLMKKESKKLLERVALAEKDMKYGHNELMNAGSQIQRLSRSVHKVEAEATDLMDELREISGRDSLKLRAEVASLATLLKRQRNLLDKRVMKVNELGIPV